MFDIIIYIIFFLTICYYLLRLFLDRFLIGNLSERPVLITGCDSGFGYYLTLKCLENGMPVFSGCLTQQGIDQLKKTAFVRRNGENLLSTFLLDVSNDESVKNGKIFVENKILNNATFKGLHALVNNAGIVGVNSWDDWLTPNHYEKVWQTNALGVVRVTHAFKNLIKRAKGRIINVASVCGRVSLPGIGPYSISKYAVEAYSDTIRLELAQFGIKVLIIEPGFFKTPITNVGENIKMLERLWADLALDIREEYGEKFFEFTKASVGKKLNCASPKIELVVDAYFHAITSIVPRKRYQIGNDCKFGFIPFSMLPAELQDLAFWLIKKIEKPPKPQKLYF